MFRRPSMLDLAIWLRGGGWSWALATALLVAALSVELVGTARLHVLVAAEAQKLDRLREAAATASAHAAPEKPLNEQRLEAFLAVLGDKGDMNGYVTALFQQAHTHGLTLAQAEYRLGADKAGGFSTYEVVLPVGGSYPQVRGFVHEVLRALPCAALADIEFKRERIGVASTEANIRFVFYLREPIS